MRKVLIFASIVICLLLLTSTASASWWNTNWKYRREITITNVNGTLTDYQVLVELNSSNFNFSHAQENGSDIRLVASDENLLSHWIEVWNSANQSAKIWVNVSEVTEGTKIFMYYGNENASDASDANATFIRVIDGVVGAWHFDEGEGTIAHDTSGEENDGTLHDANSTNNDGNTPPQWVDGKFEKALEFDGTDDYVDIPSSNVFDVTELTVSYWMKTHTPIEPGGSEWTTIIKKKSGDWYDEYRKETGELYVRLHDTSDNTHTFITNKSSWSGWNHVIWTFNGSKFRFYVNGVLDKEIEDTFTLRTVAEGLYIGQINPETQAWNGTLDEIYIYNRTLSGEEILDLYNNYGYTTSNYPNKVLVRKYTKPEPVAIIGEEVEGIFTVVKNLLIIEKEIGANYILWKWSCANPDTLVDVFVDGAEVLSGVSGVSGEYLLTDVNENELHIIKIANSFNASDYVRDGARTLPPFSFFLALLLTTFVLLVITFATTSTVRVITSIFTLLFTAFTYKYSIYYASPLSYLLLFVFFFTFALMLVEVLRILTSTIRRKPKWEEDFWNEWREGGGGL
ncbi:hypothetical protein DRJ19_04440 [Candidatus Woesearchaeota archaeon]|nr:MAG: hypothetical protein DRJ19_04440 [Candidatus Woesearchaeota archaeon]